MTLSIVIPTLGRPSLERTLDSCRDADEVIVVLDMAGGEFVLPFQTPPNTRTVAGHFGVRGGHAGRAHGVQYTTSTHLAFMDDDDIYTPGAIDAMRDAACELPVIFRMDHYQHGILWRTRDIYFGNVSTQMYLLPNQPDLFGSWTPIQPDWPQPGGDCTFIQETVEAFGGVEWRDEIIAVLRPEVARFAWA